MRLIAAVTLATSLSLTGLAPAVPVAAQTLSASEVASISGTRWSGVVQWTDGARYDTTLYFRPDGVLIYGYNGQTWDNGRWTQNERLVTYHTNTYYALHVGLTDGRTFSGSSYNRAGNRGDFRFTRGS